MNDYIKRSDAMDIVVRQIPLSVDERKVDRIIEMIKSYETHILLKASDPKSKKGAQRRNAAAATKIAPPMTASRQLKPCKK